MEIKHLELGFVNAYLIKTPAGPFLVDCGMAFSRAKLEQQLSMYGIAPADIKLLIVTHADIDHIGNCAYLQKQHGVKIAVHQGDADMCRTGKTDMNRQRKASWLSKLMRPLVVALLYKPMMKKFPLEPFEPDIILDDGHNFTDIGLDAVAIHIPGHTMGSIGLYTTDDDFFSGDTLLNHKKPTTAHIIQNQTALDASLQIIKDLHIKKVYPGHGQPFRMEDAELWGD